MYVKIDVDRRFSANLPGLDSGGVGSQLCRRLRCRRGYDIEGGVLTKCLEGLNLLVKGAFAAA